MHNYLLKIDGMYCSMCESHVNDVIRNNFNVKKVKSSHSKKETLIVTDEKIDEAKLKKVLHDIGYEVLEINMK